MISLILVYQVVTSVPSGHKCTKWSQLYQVVTMISLVYQVVTRETKEELDGFIQAMEKVRSEMMNEPEFVRGAPYNTPIRRLDDVKAARDLDLAWHGKPREVPSAVGN